MNNKHYRWKNVYWLSASLFFAACSMETDDEDDASEESEALTTDAGDAGGCTSNAQCNDGYACTFDRCVSGVCRYTLVISPYCKR